MNSKLNLNAPIRTLFVEILSHDYEASGIFGRTKEEDPFFKDLLTIGFDFYELLDFFANRDALTKSLVSCITDNVQDCQTITDITEKGLRKMIPHWTASKHHTATIENVCSEIKEHIEEKHFGAFVYNSNMNTKNKKAYNDTYILMISEKGMFFFDTNRRKSYKILTPDRS